MLATVYDGLQDERPMEHKEIAAERSYAFTMVKGYLEWVETSGVDAEYDVVSTEADTSVPLFLPDGRAVVLRGKLDQVVQRRDGTGTRLLRDYKTVGSLAKANDLARDTQMRTYDLLHTLHTEQEPDGHTTDGVLYTMLLRSKRTSRATPPFYDVAHMRYNVHDRRSTRAAIMETATDMAHVRAELDGGRPHQAVAYANPGEYCNWACPFKTVCPMADDGSRLGDALESGFVRSDPWDHYGTDPMDEVRKALGAPNRGKLVNQESGSDEEG